MKELTIQEKAKAYEKAIERAKGLIDFCSDNELKTLEFVFPELKESEDAQSKKWILEYLYDGLRKSDEQFKDDFKIAIAWLEKQGEQKSIWHNEDEEPKRDSLILLIMQSGTPIVAKIIEPNHTFNHGERWAYIDDLLEKQGEKPQGKFALDAINEEKVDNADKVESKFHKDDWIIIPHLGIYKIVEICDKFYKLVDTNDIYKNIAFELIEPKARLWTIQDAKDGDVLYATGFHNDCIFIFNGLDNWRFDEPNGDRAVATGYCCLSISADNMEFGVQGPDCIEVNTVKPATKIQRDLLFQKMKEAGYKLDEKFNLVKI